MILIKAMGSNTFLYFGKLLMIDAWHPGYDFRKHDIKEVQVWTKLFNLNMEMWTVNTLSMIGIFIRIPLRLIVTVCRFFYKAC